MSFIPSKKYTEDEKGNFYTNHYINGGDFPHNGMFISNILINIPAALRYGWRYNKLCNVEVPPLKRGVAPSGRGTGFAKLPPAPLITDVRLGPNK